MNAHVAFRLLISGIATLAIVGVAVSAVAVGGAVKSSFCGSFKTGETFDPAATELLMKKLGFMSAGVRIDKKRKHNDPTGAGETFGKMDPKGVVEVNMVTKSVENRRSVKLDLKSGIITKITCSQEKAEGQYGHLRSDGTIE